MDTNLKVIKNFSLNEEVEFLRRMSSEKWEPWIEWFDSQYCSSCNSYDTSYSETGEEIQILTCEKDYCPILKDKISEDKMIRLWLLSGNNFTF